MMVKVVVYFGVALHCKETYFPKAFKDFIRTSYVKSLWSKSTVKPFPNGQILDANSLKQLGLIDPGVDLELTDDKCFMLRGWNGGTEILRVCWISDKLYNLTYDYSVPVKNILTQLFLTWIRDKKDLKHPQYNQNTSLRDFWMGLVQEAVATSRNRGLPCLFQRICLPQKPCLPFRFTRY